MYAINLEIRELKKRYHKKMRKRVVCQSAFGFVASNMQQYWSNSSLEIS